MKRLTMRNSDGTVSQPYGVTVEEVFYRLAEYEDTGLEPDEILSGKELAEVACALISLKEYKSLGTIDHIRDLLKAEQDGRLVVLPCNVGNTVYVIGEKQIMRCDIDEVHLYDKNVLEYLVSFDCDSDCTGCPFNPWRQDYSGECFCDGEYGQVSIFSADFGKTVFLTREEAEAALEKTGGNQ